MSTKIKGILKSLRFIYQVFEEKKEHQDIQIGNPTDVKHVAHIGWDGASVDQPPTWMKEYNSTNEHHTKSLNNDNGTQARGANQKVSKDSSRAYLSDSPVSLRTKERSMTATSTSDNSQTLKSSTSTRQRRPKKQLSTGTSKSSPSKQPTRKNKDVSIRSDSTDPEEGSVKKVRQKKLKDSEGRVSNRPSKSLKDNNITLSSPS
ncbi:CRIB domain-containing protein RIC10-like [Impatiens glandulifera]|uniref:CRIB domain-containing protein RIC10-like n=1 Tax=Impatiens glandulifera TaxID=253017 RepID=UPI001FB0F73D|nr:CRIB domain-containing protein RIC10-like [Impatiens glandulifera]